MKKGRIKVMMGNEACVEAALLAGCRFYAGYPITPATEILEVMSMRLPLLDGLCLQMEDEIAAMVSVVAASWGGGKSMTATSGPGFCLMQEAIGLAVAVEAPCVIVNVQRGGPASGQSTSTAQGDFYQARYGSNGDYSLIVLCPSTAQEMFDHTIKAFNLSERFRTPVIILSDEVVGHIREKVFIPDADQLTFVPRKRPTVPMEEFIAWKADADGVPPMPDFNTGYKIPVISQAKSLDGNRGNAKEADENIRRIVSKIEDHMDEFAEVLIYGAEKAETAFVTFGSVCRAARSAVDMGREKGLALRSVEVKTVWPFPDELVRRALAGAKRIVVAEMNLGMIKREIERVVRQPEIKIELFSKIGGIYPQPQEFLRFLEEKR
ncbi:MAG: 2-oxoacid:acceptor oxidoreductase subunit alpha [Proteobacteria bacterium]|nr:2-oxoacid:acceptor oxidoreductase subunit alpha [Pseudomonadota bacterium]MBU2262482.1 2-oxoacid:acceptor oxidoreductase subunit alpha [Pseudomonadota bacterium]